LRDSGHPLELNEQRSLQLPYLFLFGRSDQTISIMGANIYPEDVERAIFVQPELASGFASFTMSVETRSNSSVYPQLSIEWTSSKPPELPLTLLAEKISQEIAKINSDFRTALTEHPEPLRFELSIYGFGQGPFAGRNRRIKNRYLGGPRQ
jgi:phenylacetate-CoA ligase